MKEHFRWLSFISSTWLCVISSILLDIYCGYRLAVCQLSTLDQLNYFLLFIYSRTPVLHANRDHFYQIWFLFFPYSRKIEAHLLDFSMTF